MVCANAGPMVVPNVGFNQPPTPDLYSLNVGLPMSALPGGLVFQVCAVLFATVHHVTAFPVIGSMFNICHSAVQHIRARMPELDNAVLCRNQGC